MKKFKVIYLDANGIKSEKIILASCSDMAKVKFSNSNSYSKIESVEEI